jgi:hypothetical protein
MLRKWKIWRTRWVIIFIIAVVILVYAVLSIIMVVGYFK